MSNLDIRIVKLDAMRVASAYGFGKSPEGIAIQKMQEFAMSKGLPIHDGLTTFGFNNPNPSPASPKYGYEVWLPVGAEVEPEGDIRIQYFSGGLYAVTQFTNLFKIGDFWKQLVIWREDSKYQCANHQWLEEFLSRPDTEPEHCTFNLYLPIAGQKAQ